MVPSLHAGLHAGFNAGCQPAFNGGFRPTSAPAQPGLTMNEATSPTFYTHEGAARRHGPKPKL